MHLGSGMDYEDQHDAVVLRQIWLQAANEQEAAALRASLELLEEEERGQARATAKKAKKDRAKAKKQQAQDQSTLQPVREPNLSSESPSADVENSEKPQALSASSAGAGRHMHQAALPAAAAGGLIYCDLGSSTASCAMPTGSNASAQQDWQPAGRRPSVSPASVLPVPATLAESAQLAPALKSETSRSCTTSFPGSSDQEQQILQLLLCPVTQVPFFT